jgi:hypothetical protein
LLIEMYQLRVISDKKFFTVSRWLWPERLPRAGTRNVPCSTVVTKQTNGLP